MPDDAWMDDAEQVDFDSSLDELDAAAGNVPAVPAILFALEHYDLPPGVLPGAAEGLPPVAPGGGRRLRSW